MRLLKFLITLWVALSISMGSYGMKFTGQMLIDACTGEPPKYPIGNCMGVIGLQIGLLRDYSSNQLTFCKPDTVIYKQSYKIVMKYMEDNPKERHKQLVHVVTAALEEAFPCDK